MKRMITLGMTVALATLASAQAQDNGSRRQRPMPPILAVLDANTNRVISVEELANAPTALKTLDKNGDGKLASDELMPQRPGGPPGGEDTAARKRFTPPFLSALDPDSDGTISAEEMAAAATSLKTLDKNGDGQLGEEELMPQPSGGRGRGGPGGRGGPAPNR